MRHQPATNMKIPPELNRARRRTAPDTFDLKTSRRIPLIWDGAEFHRSAANFVEIVNPSFHYSVTDAKVRVVLAPGLADSRLSMNHVTDATPLPGYAGAQSEQVTNDA
jgi:hypothetical protein